MVKIRPNWQKFSFSTKPGSENLILRLIKRKIPIVRLRNYHYEVQSSPFLRMSKLSKQPMRKSGQFATTSHTKGNNFANKVVEWRAKNAFVGNNSRTSTNRPYVNVNQRKKESLCESVIINTGHLKQQKWQKVFMKCDAGCNFCKS